jgi:uncharacterized membrane protein
VEFRPDRRGFVFPQESHHGGGHWAFWLIPFVFFLLLSATLLWVVIRQRGGRVMGRPVQIQGDDAALEELRLRYARGEVTREEFLATEADLRGIAPVPPPAPA